MLHRKGKTNINTCKIFLRMCKPEQIKIPVLKGNLWVCLWMVTAGRISLFTVSDFHSISSAQMYIVEEKQHS